MKDFFYNVLYNLHVDIFHNYNEINGNLINLFDLNIFLFRLLN